MNFIRNWISAIKKSEHTPLSMGLSMVFHYLAHPFPTFHASAYSFTTLYEYIFPSSKVTFIRYRPGARPCRLMVSRLLHSPIQRICLVWRFLQKKDFARQNAPTYHQPHISPQDRVYLTAGRYGCRMYEIWVSWGNDMGGFGGVNRSSGNSHFVTTNFPVWINSPQQTVYT